MQRLTGLDAALLHMATPNHPMHSTHLAVLRDEQGQRPLTRAELVAHLQARLPTLPPFRRRLVKVPLGLHHPVWVDDAGFDIATHVREVALPAPGGTAELDAMVADISQWPMDLTRPLWGCVLITGLAGGQSAVTLSVHHCMTDGRALLEIVTRLLCPDDQLEADTGRWQPEPLPTRAQLLADAWRDHRRQVRRLPELARRTRAGAAAIKQRRADAVVHVPRAKDVPIVSLNNSFVRQRVVRRTVISLADLRAVRQATGFTINDVFLGIITGALREYLGRKNDLPQRPLVVNVPVLTEGADTPIRVSGNHIGAIYVSLPVNEPDPLRRLELINESAIESKAQFDLFGPTLAEEWLDFAVPAVARPASALVQGLARWSARHGRPLSPGNNIVSSNVVGPRERYRVGPYVVDLSFFGIVTQGVGLMFTLVNYGGELGLTVTACPDAVPDPDALVDIVHLAAEELRTAFAPL